MASEFGLAQQFAYMSKTFDTKNDDQPAENRDHSSVGRFHDPDRGLYQALFRPRPASLRRQPDTATFDFIVADKFDEAWVDAMLNEYENPAKILDTNWYAIKPMYEKKYRELIHESDKFVSINGIRLSRDSVKNSIKYLREIYRHRIGKTRVISLNDYHSKY